MKIIVRIILVSLFGLLVLQESYAYKSVGTKSSGNIPKGTAAGCAAGAAYTDLWVNNVRCRINTAGDMWWDLQGVAKYFVPGNTQKTSMFSASLWIGGLDINGQLKLAAQRYRSSGNDYWPGPLTVDGNANIGSEICLQYDKHFRMSKAQVEEFRRWWFDKGAYPDYQIPESILKWPGNGDVTKGQSPYLAPFYDMEPKNGIYDPENDGDYPYYDFKNELCKANSPTPETVEGIVKGGILADQVLKGDETVWWVFNDKGNIHSETQGSPIGFEIRAQAFGFSTNDEINSMTFYSYEIINRSTYRLTETYFSQWVDTDLGDAWDDYIGCDVKRGLGYCYNGDAIDGTGKADEYGSQPPAVGVDFFQGPYMDADGLDNPKIGPDGKIMCDVSINGVNFEDGIVDNERFGMRRFVYHSNCGSGPTCDPETAPQYYNMLRGIWKDGIVMMYGGNAHPSSGATGPACDFMFPEVSDPCNWGTNGIQPPGWQTGAGGSGTIWTEANVGNPPYDRRFMQSAGPFTLEPGAVNYITVGIPWARAASGGPWGSVSLLKTVDDKCQKLFENCFKVLEGPDHPDLIVQELDREVLLYLKNYIGSNNEFETYAELDPNIITPEIDSITPGGDTISIPNPIQWDAIYRFEGYQIFQLADATVSDLTDIDKARQVAQCDLKNGVMTLINFEYNQELQANQPILMVQGTDRGILHSFRVTEDQFATGDKRLVNHKQYYFVAIAYGYNNYLQYSQDPNDPNGLNGQKKPYLIGRKQPKVQTAIPHIPNPEAMGTQVMTQYGNGPKITRIDGQGNGGMALDWTPESENELMSKTAPPYIVEHPTYMNGRGPVHVKVIDPLNVKKGDYIIKLIPDSAGGIGKSKWELTNTLTNEIYNAEADISVENEQLLLDIGLSVQIAQVLKPGRGVKPDSIMAPQNGYLESSITFADSSQIWLTGIADDDNPGPWNWIRSGVRYDEANQSINDWDVTGSSSTSYPYDPNEDFEKVVGRTWAPYNLCMAKDQQLDGAVSYSRPSRSTMKMVNLASVNIVLTKDKEKWTRCPVIEMCPDKNLSQGGAEMFNIRRSPSVDKNGKYANPGDPPSSNPDDANYINASGMGWFPGYVYNLETGERLNIIFGEDSWLVSDNGRDMLFNPTDMNPLSPFLNEHYLSNLGKVIFGGKHYVYVMAHNKNILSTTTEYDCPAYDHGYWAREFFNKNPQELPALLNYFYGNCMWVGLPMGVTGKEWLNNDCTIKIRVGKPYARYYSTNDIGATNPQNDNYPMYRFNTEDIATVTGDNEVAKSALDLINVVPNPYYAFSSYETDQLDNRVRITNLPEKCTVSIYSVNGTLVRQITKDAIKTSVDWDLKNFAGIPIAGGVYLIHIKAPGIGERVIKWFGVQRPVDLNAF